MNWYKIAQQNIEDFLGQQIESLLGEEEERVQKKEDFLRELQEVADQFSVEQREKFLSGEWGVLGYNHFIARPGVTEIALNPDTTSDDIIKENINKLGDFPVVLVWEAISDDRSPREIVPASKFIIRRASGEFDPIPWTPEQDAIWERYMKLRKDYKGLEMPENIKREIAQIEQKFVNFPSSAYVRKAFVAPSWQSPIDSNVAIDRREIEILETMRKERLQRQEKDELV